MEIDLKELRTITAESIEKGKLLHQQKMKEDSEKEHLRHDEASEWAESKLRYVPSVCKEAATKGESSAIVLSTRGCGYEATNARFPYNEFHGWKTSGDGLKYHYFCEGLKNSGIEYEVKHQHDGGGVDSWFEIVVEW